MSTNFGGGRFSKPADHRLIRYPAAAGVVISVGDLLYWDGSVVKPLSALVGSGTAATDRAAIHDAFVGVSTQQRLAAQPAGQVEVISDCIYEADCASSANYLPGDLVGAVSSGAAAAGAVSDQNVVEVSAAAESIGVVIAFTSGAITKVTCRLYGLAGRQKF